MERERERTVSGLKYNTFTRYPINTKNRRTRIYRQEGRVNNSKPQDEEIEIEREIERKQKGGRKGNRKEMEKKTK